MEIRFDDGCKYAVQLYLASHTGLWLATEVEQATKALSFAQRHLGFHAGQGQVVVVSMEGQLCLLAGIGAGEPNPEVLRRTMSWVVKECQRLSVAALSLVCPGINPTQIRAVAEGVIMTAYRYDTFLSKRREIYPKTLCLDCQVNDLLADALAEGMVLGEACNVAKDLVNEPANVQTPLHLANVAEGLGQKYGFATEILYEEEITKLGMHALLAVAQASPNPPVFIVMRYRGAPDSPEDVTCLVGKGVTFDSGGLNLKRNERFITMKHDMAGGGAVIGAMCAIAERRLKANVTAVVAASDNLVSGKAYRPGDIISTMAGKTVLINSTDAEGRLTMADAIYWAATHERASRIIDIATLTGSARRILGEWGAPVITNDQGLTKSIMVAANDCDEVVFPLPVIEDAREKLNCDIADMVNTAKSETGGCLTAALFLREFAEGVPWAHIDAAGTLWYDAASHYYSKGGTGWGTRTLYQVVKNGL